MKCPGQLARDLSAGGGWELRHPEGGRQDARILNDRLGAGDESPRGDFAGDKEITWWQAAEIIGISDRSMRRWKQRYQEHGYDGLLDRRRGQPSPKRVPLKVAEEVLQLYREKYADLNVRHFQEKLREGHGIALSYTWVKLALQGAGLVKKGRKRGVHRKRRERRPLPGMLLHL